jgi:restriction system protein
MDLLASVPWWVGLTLAPVLYFLLHGLASKPIAITTQPGAIAPQTIGAVAQALAIAGQYILPLMCLAGALVSALRRSKRRELVRDAGRAEASRIVDGMTWAEFEMLVGEAFRLQGYSVEETGGGGPDGGVDLDLSKARERYLVQCKQWRAFSVGVEVVRELYGVMAARGAAGGFVVTAGRFTRPAVEFANGRNIELLDATKLRAFLKPARSEESVESAGARMGAMPSASQVSQPYCPDCGKPMVRRTAKRGPQAGSSFWGCPDYPACRGTRVIC